MARPNQAPPSRRRDRRELSRQERPDRPRRTYRPPKRPAWQSPLALVSGAAVLVGIVVIVIFVLSGLPKGSTAGNLLTPPTAYSSDLTDGESLGAKTAPVVMEIYSDFQCPYCARLAREQLQRYVADFVKPGMLRIVARDIDIIGRGDTGNESVDLAVGARCASEQDLYWQFHDLAFWNQQAENRGLADAAFIARLADAAGVDRTKWNDCVKREDVRKAVLTTTSDSRGLGIDSTPTLRINGDNLPGGIPDYATVGALIRQLAAAASPGSSLSPVPATPAP